MGLVVLVAGAAAGEGDLAGGAPAGEVVVDELRAVVGVDTGDVEREPQPQFLQAGGDDALALGAYGDRLGPAGGDIGGVEGVVEGSVVVPAFVADQVDLEESGHRVVPLLPGLHRDRGLQHRPGPGVADRLAGHQPGSGGGEAAVDGGRRHRQHLVDHSRLDVGQVAVNRQV